MWGLGRRGGGWRRVPRLRKEFSFTILLASTWALIRGEVRQRRECHEQLWPQTGWSGVLGINFGLSFISGGLHLNKQINK